MSTKLFALAMVGVAGFSVLYAHEDHSSADEKAIRQALEATRRGNYDRDLEAATAMYKRAGERFLAFDIAPPLEDIGFVRAVEKSRKWYEGTVGPMIVEYNDPKIVVDHNHAYVTSHFHFAFTMRDGRKADTVGRATQVFERIDGTWTVIHEHTSLPTTVGFSWSE